MAKAERSIDRDVQGDGVMSKHSARGMAWTAFRETCIKRAGFRCERCKRRGRLEVHHKRALAHGGEKFSFANVEVLCRRCHFAEHKPHVAPERQQWLDHVGI